MNLDPESQNASTPDPLPSQAYSTPPPIESEPAAALPRVWPSILVPFVAIVVAIGVQIVMVVAFIFYQGVGDFDQDALTDAITSPPGFLAMLLSGQLSFLVVVIVAAIFSPEPIRQRLAFPPSFASAKIYLLTTIGSIPILALSLAAAYGVSKFSWADDSAAAFFEKITIAWAIPFVILIALLPGFIEEIMFRGYIQTRFLKRWSPVATIALSSFLFALVHLSPPTVALAFIMGIWLGYIAWRCGSIGPGIACHAFVNGGLNLWRMIVKFTGISETTQYVCLGVFAVAGIICFILAIRELEKLPPPKAAA